MQHLTQLILALPDSFLGGDAGSSLIDALLKSHDEQIEFLEAEKTLAAENLEAEEAKEKFRLAKLAMGLGKTLEIEDAQMRVRSNQELGKLGDESKGKQPLKKALKTYLGVVRVTEGEGGHGPVFWVLGGYRPVVLEGLGTISNLSAHLRT